MPTTVSGVSPVAIQVMSSVLPTVRPFPSASVRDTITEFGCDRSATDPDNMSMFITSVAFSGSTAVTNVSEPAARASLWRIGVTVARSGSVARSFASCGEIGLNCCEDSVRSARSTSSSVLVAEALSDAAKTQTNETRPRPMTSAAAVDAVRRGLRLAFSLPSLPGADRRSGLPIAEASGRAKNGSSIVTPRKVRAAPRPTIAPGFDTLPNSAWAMASTPSAVTIDPKMIRRRMPALGATDSRSASTGARRAARRAGEMAAAIVMIVPSRTETMTVRGSSTSAVGGSCSPSELRNAFSTSARSMPSPTPTIEAMSPTTNDSMRTDRSTWRRLAPSARNSASSRLRCDTTMLNVLKMMNAPTNRATNPKIRKNVRRNPSAVVT